jgi:hypothetical protein
MKFFVAFNKVDVGLRHVFGEVFFAETDLLDGREVGVGVDVGGGGDMETVGQFDGFDH